MDKVRDKKIRVIIETCGSLCDVGRIIEDGQEACKRRWTASEVLLNLLGFPMLEPIEEVPSPKLKSDEAN